MRSGVFMPKDNLRNAMRAVQQLTRRQVLVGIPEKNTERDDGPATNALIGYVSEFGSPKNNVPARPHLMPGIREAREQITRHMKAAAFAALRAGIGGKGLRETDQDIDKELTKTGLIAVSSVQNIIKAGIPPPLKQSTLDARKRRGRKGTTTESTTPLIDTGAYWQHLTFVIDQKKPMDKGVAPSPARLNLGDYGPTPAGKGLESEGEE